ncbi:DUF2335 domain-containing protein [Candidatus Uhrbacteria bacterium]|nr:DUF2335 domain-containing protein [Candidatus Uhrbacteria bacterium]
MQANSPASQDERRIFSATQELHVGPLPKPQDFEYYERVLPGAAQRILAMAEQQSMHRRKQENRVILGDLIKSAVGLLFGFLIGMASIIGGIWLVYQGKSVTGGFISFTGVAALTSVFVYGSQQRRREREERRITN